MPADWSRALAIVAHPDDIEYWAAPAVAVWSDEGKSVAYVHVTRGERGMDGIHPEKAGPIREREERASAAVVGVTRVEFLDHPDGRVCASDDLRRDLAHAVRRHRPDLVLTLNHHEHWRGVSWNTSDHRVVGRGALDAAADAGNRWLWPHDDLEPWEGVKYLAVAGSPRPTHAVDARPGLERGVSAVLAHSTYLDGLTDEDPADYVRTFYQRNTEAAARSFAGVPAVSFEVFTRDAYRDRDGQTHYR